MKRLLLLALICLGASRAGAQAFAPQEPSSRDIVVAYNTGHRFSIAPGVFIPNGGGNIGFSIAGDYRYGIEVGPIVVAPGARIAGYFPSGYYILTALATARITFPLGPVGPYVLGGIGPGYVSEPSKTGAAWMGGGGLMVYIGRSFGIGAEATYQGVTGSDFRALFIGPALMLAF